MLQSAGLSQRSVRLVNFGNKSSRFPLYAVMEPLNSSLIVRLFSVEAELIGTRVQVNCGLALLNVMSRVSRLVNGVNVPTYSLK